MLQMILEAELSSYQEVKEAINKILKEWKQAKRNGTKIVLELWTDAQAQGDSHGQSSELHIVHKI